MVVESGSGSRRSGMSIRTRIALSAAAIVAIALVLGAVAFGALLQDALHEEVRASAERDAEEIAARIESPGGLANLDGIEYDDDERFFAVISESGELLAASDKASDLPLSALDEDDDRELRVPGGDADYLVASEGADGDATVYAGHSLESATETLGTVVGLLVVAVPLLIALIALTSWFVVGRSLTPVELMRREVDEVTATSLDRRVADPGSSDEIGRLARTMNDMLARLEQSQRSQRRFISDASHELRSPLASLRQYAEVARTHPDRIDAVELSAAVLDEGARLERLVQGMLVLARADERSLGGTRAAVDLDDLVLREARRLRSSTSLRVDTTQVGPARVLGDEGLLDQVVRNLVDNAARHAVSAVSLSLTADEDGTVSVTVEDDGGGVPDGERERIFERFVRLDEARARESGGSGLGLSIVREIAAAHDGAVRVTNGAQGGARFVVVLPAMPDAS